MRKFMSVLTLGMLAGCGLIGGNSGGGGSGGGGSTMPDPTLYNNMYQSWDVSKLKEGDFVEYETIASGNKSTSRMACVKVETDIVWVETYGGGAAWVTLLGINKSDRLLKKAYYGEKGKEAHEVKVTAPPAAGAASGTKTKGTAKVSNESVTIKTTTFPCEKIDMNMTYTTNGSDMVSHSTTWYSEKVPFRYYVDEKNQPKNDSNYNVTWDGKATMPGGLVKMTSETSGYKSEQLLSNWGTDAKMSVTLPATK